MTKIFLACFGRPALCSTLVVAMLDYGGGGVKVAAALLSRGKNVAKTQTQNKGYFVQHYLLPNKGRLTKHSIFQNVCRSAKGVKG